MIVRQSAAPPPREILKAIAAHLRVDTKIQYELIAQVKAV